jgi:hypothetical protein
MKKFLTTPQVGELIEARTGWRPCDLTIRNWTQTGLMGPRNRYVMLKATKPSKNYLFELRVVERFIADNLTPELVASRSRMGTPTTSATKN